MSDVLIVGAGPTGLALALRLHDLGVGVRIIDKHESVLGLTKSAALHARTMEHLRDLGLADAVLDEGQRVEHLTLRTGHRDRISVDFRTLHDTAYPFLLDHPQDRTEHLLIEELARRGVAVERAAACVGIEQHGDGVRATVAVGGRTRTLEARWLVGCDGVRSTVRRLLGIERTGAPYPDDWVLFDADIDWPLPRNELTFSADGEGLFGVFPLPGERRYRVAYTPTPGVEPSMEDAQRSMARSGVEGTILAVDNLRPFTLAHMQAVRYRRGRVFLAGDAAHVHTPFAGQGLNLGIGDAMNLAWRLAAVAHGADARLLDAYQAERHPVAASVIAMTHRTAQAMLLRDDPRRHLRDAVMTVLQASERARRALARRLSQLDHHYRGAPGVAGRAHGLAGGDRLPDLEFFDGLSQRAGRLHEFLPYDRHTMLLTDPAQTVGLTVPDSCAVRLITPDWARARTAQNVPTALDRGRSAARLYGSAYLVRPDRHVAGIGSPSDLAAAAALDSHEEVG
ncbi:FAD-binding monooxygenase [Nocardiopsis sp. CNR-923]|uniref:FAD-dependent monooxygenase n=1 Tax=Nocardiopsis sp. CNR-923 TaxID=1904965 RepID=UPI0009671088|nr:FAD-dependent monooxygenase [Nocardiopsis sp. CNR-923]OLT25570.1 FAD-binding monooxygenase [Nocardiopsis sp. CNR-923]